MMNELAREKIVQYLQEAHATELSLAQTLGAHIAMTPVGRYRTSLEAHLTETHDHAERIERHLRKQESKRSALQVGYGLANGVAGQVIAMTKVPLELVRGTSFEEKLLKNAKDEYAAEAAEIAMYAALEHFATTVGDTQTAKLAASIRADEEQMLERLLDEIPSLVDDVISADVDGTPRFSAVRIGAVDAARSVAEAAAGTVARSARRVARRAEPGPAPRRKPTARERAAQPAEKSAAARKRTTTKKSTNTKRATASSRK